MFKNPFAREDVKTAFFIEFNKLKTQEEYKKDTAAMVQALAEIQGISEQEVRNIIQQRNNKRKAFISKAKGIFFLVIIVFCIGCYYWCYYKWLLQKQTSKTL